MNVLAIIQGALGDGVMALWGLQAVVEHTGCSLTLFCAPGLGALAKELGLAQAAFPVQSPEIASLYGPAPSPWVREQIQARDRVLVFSFSQDLFSAVQSLSNKAYSVPPRPQPGERVHVLDRMVERLQKAGLVDPKAGTSYSHRLHAFDLYARTKRPADAPVLLHPGSGSSRKNWPLKSFGSLFDALKEKGIPGKLVLGPDDHGLERGLEAWTSNPEVLRPQSLLEFKDLLTASRAYAGNDSGATHVAAMLGMPTAALFGPSDPVRWRPVGPRVQVFRGECESAPCFETKEKNCRDGKCLDSIAPGEILEFLELAP
ncbi:glycosyltransferase family 9 protein [Desulfatibacillum aliphaticivorans]|uniref:glycosyltransferase family 9 protein n=1 Tax=Desulfatibacillum aliphaticivorans TaxID=218208 RepID=UPI0004243A1A|nr:glycosyltransferase family 9 protein [Desulfatibacillum aliphaticivorans]